MGSFITSRNSPSFTSGIFHASSLGPAAYSLMESKQSLLILLWNCRIFKFFLVFLRYWTYIQFKLLHVTVCDYNFQLGQRQTNKWAGFNLQHWISWPWCVRLLSLLSSRFGAEYFHQHGHTPALPSGRKQNYTRTLTIPTAFCIILRYFEEDQKLF